MADLSAEKKRIIYVARIEKKTKRPHLLVEAFAKIAAEFPDWKVEIWGMRKYPEYEKEINDFIRAHNLTGQVALMGYTEDVEGLYRRADIHAFPSASEGFSLAIADAMSIGLPHIGFKDAHSVNEIIVNGHNGFLADNVDDFAAKLKILMKDKELRIKFGHNAHEDMKAYAPEILMNQWEELFQKLCPANPDTKNSAPASIWRCAVGCWLPFAASAPALSLAPPYPFQSSAVPLERNTSERLKNLCPSCSRKAKSGCG